MFEFVAARSDNFLSCTCAGGSEISGILVMSPDELTKEGL